MKRAFLIIIAVLLIASIGANISLALRYHDEREKNELMTDRTENELAGTVDTNRQYLEQLVPALEAALDDGEWIEETWGSVESFLKYIDDDMIYIDENLMEQKSYDVILFGAESPDCAAPAGVARDIRKMIAGGEALSDILTDACDFLSALLASYQKGCSESDDITVVNHEILCDIEDNYVFYANFWNR